MNYIIKEMIGLFEDNIQNNKNVLREVLQKVILYSLYKVPLGNNCCFIGGTCLRIFYKIDRFSQDLDFVTINKENIDIKSSLDKMVEILQSFGLKTQYYIKQKTIQSNTLVVYFSFDLQDLYDNYYPEQNWKLTNGQSLKIELDFDTTKYKNIKVDTMFDVFPQFFQTKLFDLSTLFASKIAAIFLRTWNDRGFKGRDLYDYLFYISINAKINYDFLKEKLLLSNKINDDELIDCQKVKAMLINKFNQIDFKQAKDDVAMFVKHTETLDNWSKEFFIEITKQKLID